MTVINTIGDMKKTVQLLNQWTQAYDKGQPLVTDKEWDDLYFRLQEAEKKLGIILPQSPTNKIIYSVVNELKKVRHNEKYPMLSLNKTKDVVTIESQFGNKDWIAMPKCDGLSCRVIYKGGKLLQASTRGNGLEGEDITHNVRFLVPPVIPHNGDLIIDGEVVCLDKDFKEFAGQYANSRNFAAGSIRLLNSAESVKRKLTFIAWDCIYDSAQVEDTTLSSQLTDLFLLGFKVVDCIISADELNFRAAITALKSSSKIVGLPIDGIVFKLNNKKEYNAQGATAHHPCGACAFKFYDETAETKLLDIEYTMGRTGVLTPVAIYEDVELEGTICNRASLHNLSVMEATLGIPHIGQKIWVAKQNQIIPQIVKAECINEPEARLTPPIVCPVCGASIERRGSDSGTIELYCSNDACEGKLVNRLEHFAGKKGLDIKGLSKATFEKLIEWGWVEKAQDIFFLYQHEKEWIAKAGFGEKSVKKILDAIEEARHTTLEAYICALGIPLIGRAHARILVQEFGDYETFRSRMENGFNFMKLEGFGPEKHDAIMNFDYAEADMIVHRNIIDFVEEAALAKNGNSLEGLTFCVTGKLKYYKNRDLLKAEIIARGGKVTESVTPKTSYLVNNDINSTSTKNKKAKELNIPIITEEELMKMV